MKLSYFFLEFWAIIFLPFPVSSAIILLSLYLSGWRGSEQFVKDIVNGNKVVVVLVQIFSQALGLILVQALCTLIKIQFRSSIVKRPISLNVARFLNALSQTRPILSENHVLTTVTVFIALLSTIPGAIWAGAISPRISTATVDRHIQVPDYSHYLGGQNFTTRQNANGTFTNNPSDVIGLLLYSAQRASNSDAPGGVKSSHTKLDNTGYTFYGRNYGAGSTVGLSSIPSTLMPLFYSYNETGIVASTHCQRNTSSTFTIVKNITSFGDSGAAGTTGYTTGTYSDGTPVASIWLYGAIYNDLFAMEQNWYPDSRRTEVVVASGADESYPTFIPYQQMQCEATFTSHTIQVNVNTTSQTITTDVLDEVEWPPYADAVMTQATFALPLLTATDNGFGNSRVAQAMQSNTRTLYYRKYGIFPDTNVSDDILSESIADFVTNVFENMLTLIGSCRKECNATTQAVPVQVIVPGVVYGNEGFIYAVFAMSVLVALACAYFIIAKRAWKHVVELDFTDIADVALNASKGGTKLFDCYEKKGCLSETYIALRDPSTQWPSIVCTNSVEKVIRGGSVLSRPLSNIPSISPGSPAQQQETRDLYLP